MKGLQWMFTWTLVRPLTWSSIVSLLSNWQNIHQISALVWLDCQAQRVVSSSTKSNWCLVTSSVLHGPYLGQYCSMSVLMTWIIGWSALSARLQISHCGQQLICQRAGELFAGTSTGWKNGMTGTSQSPAHGIGKPPPLRLGFTGYKAAFQ